MYSDKEIAVWHFTVAKAHGAARISLGGSPFRDEKPQAA